MNTTTHQAGARLDYGIDFAPVLGVGETIVSFEVSATGVTLEGTARAGTVVTAVVNGGAAGTNGRIRFTAITATRRYVQPICLRIANICAITPANP